MKKFTAKIIHIINHPPAYEEYADKPRPAINWDTPNGSWVGIWGYDWSDQIANECIKISNEFEHEVWQPDLRADKMYSHTFENGMTHRIFPAIERTSKEISAPEMLNFLSKENFKDKYIFNLGYPHFIGLNKDIIDTHRGHRFVLTFHGEVNLPYNALFRLQKNILKKLYYLRQHFLAKKYLKLVNHITYPSEKNIDTLRKYYNGGVTKLTMGIDSDKFKVIDKNECRNKLRIPKDKKVLLTVSRLYDLKQVDKIIEILNEINEEFIFIVVGHGTREYEKYLRDKAKQLLYNNRIRFEGYKTANELVDYYNSADLFIHTSKSEAGPVSVMEAMACGLPIFCTDVGNTAEILKENNAGILVGIKEYDDWKEKLIEFLNGSAIPALDIDIVKQHYDWQNVAKKFLEIYKGALNGN